MINVAGSPHKVTDLLLTELSVTSWGDKIMAILAIKKGSETCGRATISGGDLSKETLDAYQKFVELLEKDAAKRLFDIDDSGYTPELNPSDVSPF